LRILNHEESAPGGNLINLGAWTGVSCAPGEVRLVIKLVYPYTKGDVPDPKWYQAIHKYDGSRRGLKKAIVEFLESGAQAKDKDVHQAMIYLLQIFK